MPDDRAVEIVESLPESVWGVVIQESWHGHDADGIFGYLRMDSRLAVVRAVLDHLETGPRP